MNKLRRKEGRERAFHMLSLLVIAGKIRGK